MNSLKNQVQLIGRIGNDTELKTLENGNEVINFSMATNENYKNKRGEKHEKTEWHRLSAWGKTAVLIHELCNKGDELLVKGKLTHNTYEKNGETRYHTTVVVNEFLRLSSVQKDNE